MFSVYILVNPQGRLYIGQTDDLERRIGEHNSIAHNPHKYTSKFPGPWQLVYSEPFDTRADAMAREKFIKSRKSSRWIEQNLLKR